MLTTIEVLDEKIIQKLLSKEFLVNPLSVLGELGLTKEQQSVLLVRDVSELALLEVN